LTAPVSFLQAISGEEARRILLLGSVV